MNYKEWKEMMLSEDGEFVYLSDENKKEQYKESMKRRINNETVHDSQ